VTLLIDLCNAIIAAEAAGTLSKRYVRIARQAHVIVGASAKSGIQGLVYRLAGYNPTAEDWRDTEVPCPPALHDQV